MSSLQQATPATIPLVSSPQNKGSLLWQEAFSKLDPTLQDSLSSVRISNRDVIAAVLQTAEDCRLQCIRKQWRFRAPGGRVVVLRDVLEKLVRWLDRFKFAVDAAVQYDPAHAALPWAAVRFLLQVAIDDVQAFGAITVSLETLARVMVRCAKVEELHLQKALLVEGNLEEALSRLYADVLTSLAKAVKYFQKSSGGEFLRYVRFPLLTCCCLARLFAGAIEPVVLQSIDDQEQEIMSLVSLAHSEILQGLDMQMNRLMDASVVVHKTLLQQETIELLSWLSSTRVHDHHRFYSAGRLSGSGKWLIDHTIYRSWLESSSSSMLLLQGIRGCGKTVLTSIVIESLQQPNGLPSSVQGVPCLFFYCAGLAGEPDRAAPDSILRAIIRQLAVRPGHPTTVNELVTMVYDNKVACAQPDRIDLVPLTTEECISLLLSLTAANPAYIVIDAVDELPEESRATLLRALQRIMDESPNLVKVFISSRYCSHVDALLTDNVVKIQVSPQANLQDLQNFVRVQIDQVINNKRMLNGRVPLDLKLKVAKALIDGAGGM